MIIGYEVIEVYKKMKPLCADERIWGGAPPKEFYIPTEKLTAKQSEKLKAWRQEISKKWDNRKLWQYLSDNKITSQDLSDEELNQFRKDL